LKGEKRGNGNMGRRRLLELSHLAGVGPGQGPERKREGQKKKEHAIPPGRWPQPGRTYGEDVSTRHGVGINEKVRGIGGR
jgi:hypothetical protein